MYDHEVWPLFQHHHNWFNKLWVAERYGYKCGPSGVAPTEDGTYVIRPIYNLSGMGVGAHVKKIKAGDYHAVPAGYFWCEYLHGDHYSVNYKWKHSYYEGGSWEPVSSWKGVNYPVNLTKFAEWKRSNVMPNLKDYDMDVLYDAGEINVEFKGKSIIEVHLRHSPDPDYDKFIPVWESDTEPECSPSVYKLNVKCQHYLNECGYEFLPDFDDGDGQLKDPRIGFLVK